MAIMYIILSRVLQVLTRRFIYHFVIICPCQLRDLESLVISAQVVVDGARVTAMTTREEPVALLFQFPAVPIVRKLLAVAALLSVYVLREMLRKRLSSACFGTLEMILKSD